jgi:hypothetical protein
MILHENEPQATSGRLSPKKVATAVVALFVTAFTLIAAINVYPQLREVYGEDMADIVLFYGAFLLFALWQMTPVDVSLDETDRPKDDDL